MPSTIIIILLLQLLLIIFSPPANGEKIVDLTIGKLPMDMVQIMLYPQGTFKWRDLTFQSLSQIISEYGCYCGRGKSGMPVDSVDRCCMNHDECYTKLFKLQHCANLLPPEKYAGRFLTTDGVNNCNSDNACMEQICSCDTAFIGCLMSGEDTPRQGGRQCVPVPPPLPPTTTQPITQPPPPPTQSPPPPTQPPAPPSPPAPTTETPPSPPTPTSTTPVPLPPSPPTTVTSTPSPTTDKESRVETTSTSTSRSVQPETTSSSTDGSSTSIKDPAQTLKQQKTRWTQPVRDGKLFGFFGTGLTPLPPNLA